MKQHLSRFLLAAVLLGMFAVANAKFKVGDLYYNIIDSENKEVEVTYQSYDSYWDWEDLMNYSWVSKIVVPEKITYNEEEYTVTQVGNYAFRYANSNMWKKSSFTITLPNTIKKIGKNAFERCSLSKLEIPKNLTQIDSYAFAGASISTFVWPTNLTKICDYAFEKYSGSKLELPSTVTEIETGAFSGSSIKSVTIPEGVTKIASYTFKECLSLIRIDIPAQITEIGTNAFYGCTKLFKVLNYSNSFDVTKGSPTNGYVGCYAFTVVNRPVLGQDGDFVYYTEGGQKYLLDYLGSASTVNVPGTYQIAGGAFYRSTVSKIVVNQGTTFVGDGAFYDGFISNVVLPESVTDLGEAVFQDCNLSKVTLPAKLAKLPNNTFRDCPNLKELTLPSTITEIGENAFSKSGLIRVELPSSLQKIGANAFYATKLRCVCLPQPLVTIGDKAFYSCSSLKKVINQSVLEIEKGASTQGYVAWYANTVVNASEIIEEDNLWYYVEDDVKYLYDYTGYSGYVTIPGDCQIAPSAFYGNTTITYVSLTSGITTIGEYAFAEAENLGTIYLPSGVTTIGRSAFQNCKSLNYITLPESLTKVSDYMCSGCSALKNVYTPKAGNIYTEIGISAFSKCNKLESIELPNTLLSISTSAFNDCSQLNEIVLPLSLNSIGGYAFNSSGIKKITVPEGITSLPSRVFAWSSLSEITLPSTLKRIEDGAFDYCSLKTVELPEGLNYIGSSAFGQCYNLKSISIPASVETIEDGAFYYCDSLTDVEINVNPNLVIDYEVFLNDFALRRVILRGTNTVKECGDAAFGYEYYYDWDCVDSDDYYIANCATLYVDASLLETYKAMDTWKEFGNIYSIEKFSQLSDEASYLSNLQIDEVPAISYTRDFKNTCWQSLYLPFSLKYDDWKDNFEVAYINGFRQVDVDEDGEIDETYMDIVKIRNGSLKAGTPYLIKAKQTGLQTLTAQNGTLYPQSNNSVECSTMLKTFVVSGSTFSIDTRELEDDNLYGLSSNSLHPLTEDITINPFRWYLSVTDRNSAYNFESDAPQQIRVRVYGEEEDANGITVLTQEEEEVLTFDLNGRIIENKNQGKPGFYIRNGQKYIIK